MKNIFLKVLTGVTLMTFWFIGNNTSVDAAQITKTLTDNTRITPAGVIATSWGAIPKFKKGTVVTLNEFGEVFEGVLAENIGLPYESGRSQDSVRPASYTPMPFYVIPSVPANVEPPKRILLFKGGTTVTFNDKGEVIKGTISTSGEDITLNSANRIRVASGEISFHRNGMPATCTLAGDSYLRPVGWRQVLTDNFTENAACAGFVEFKGGQPVELNEKGEVVKGTLNKNTKLLSPLSILSPDSDGIKVYEAGTTVEFGEKGVVMKATKAASTVN
ncbi:hypothetical protein [Sporomusa aerivorans]|uniref:hypothetical protein n=1 Tax=Sporomusa aerivorans TaxID=204936 RepID=UPI00352A3F1D